MLGDRFDETLELARSGDVDAFAELWRDTHPMLLRYLRVTARGEADDIGSQTWVRVIEALPGFEGSEPQFRRWVVTIARNLHLDHLRRIGRRPETLVGEHDELPVEAAPDASTVAEERMSTGRALELIAGLPDSQAELVMLRVVLGLDVADVAQMVGKSPGAVRVAVHRALRALEQQLSGPQALAVTPPDDDAFFGHDA